MMLMSCWLEMISEGDGTRRDKEIKEKKSGDNFSKLQFINE
jgi:hypothetical protein